MIFRHVTRRHGIWFKFKIIRNQMIRNKNIQRPNFSKKAHFINRHHHPIHHFILKRLQHHRPILYSKLHSPRPRTILNNSPPESFMTENGNYIPVSTGAMTFYLGQQSLLEEGWEGWSEVLWG